MGETTPDQPLNAEEISNLMSPSARLQLRHLTVLGTIDSTNSELQRLPGTEQHAHAILAESQSKGRGRRARHWHSPPGCNIYLSLGWQFSVGQEGLSTVPLLAAICACRALSRLGLNGHGIKWPNDVLINGDKTAGILVEMQAVAGGPATAVIGLGMNVNMPPGSHQQQEAEQAIDRRWTDLSSHLKEPGPISRNAVSALLLEELIEGARTYETRGFSHFQKDWDSLDLLSGHQVEVQHQDRVTTGIARGIDSAGGLKLETTGESSAHEYQVFHAGEVRVFHA
jgi:BirA family biotin operon repressor/biotin-[acetyl-CoA-carboxylase] ligase